MNKVFKTKREQLIFRYISTIVFTSLFLILSSVFIFLPKKANLMGAFAFLANADGVSFVPVSSDLVLEKAYPITDKQGLEVEPFVFEIQNKNTTASKVQVIFQTGEGGNRLSQNSIKYTIGESESASDIQVLSEDGIILEVELAANDVKRYYLKFWVQDEQKEDITGKYFQATIELKKIME